MNSELIYRRPCVVCKGVGGFVEDSPTDRICEACDGAGGDEIRLDPDRVLLHGFVVAPDRANVALPTYVHDILDVLDRESQ